MANGPTLPPQAYTREILTSAFNWLQTQPESVRKLATTPDALVGLFMRAQRYGASSLEADAPVSSQNFISDLKNLAEGLKQFDSPVSSASQVSAQSAGQPPQSFNSARAAAAFQQQAQTMTMERPAPAYRPPMESENQGFNGGYHGFSQGFQAPQAPLSMPNAPSQPALQGLTDRTREMVREVKNALNLSSDTEAINLMAALAYKNLKTLLA